MSWNKPSTGGGSGTPGKSAYQTWLDLGNTGTEQDFINSLKGDKGDKGDPGTSSGAGTKHVHISPLHLPSADGYYEQYHPSVAYMPNGWNGYKFWMATTPYPFMSSEGGEAHENPHIFASHDGYEWVVPEGLVNPIDAAESGYMSDTHLFYRTDLNRMECWYRLSTSGTDILRKVSTDGVTWSAREVLIDDATSASFGISSIVRSQAVMWWPATSKYRMWYNTNINGEKIFYAESSDGYTWTNETQCSLSGLTHTPWHLDVAYYSGTTKFYLTSFTKAGHLYLFDSLDGINFNYLKTLLSVSDATGTDFFHDGLYRSILVRIGTSGGHWRLYYSGYDSTQKYAGIGVMEGQLLELKHVSGNYHIRKQAFHKGIEVVNTRVIKNGIQLADTGECIGFDYATKEPYFQKVDGTKIYFTR